MTHPYEDGYHHGLINDRANPHPPWSPLALLWAAGNLAGVAVGNLFK